MRFLYALLFPLLLGFWFVAYKYGAEADNLSSQSVLLGALLIFLLRLSDMTLDTLRLTFTMRGHKYLAALVGFMQAAIVVVAIARVVKNVTNVWNIVAYAGGFACGILVGMTLEERMALGFVHLQIFSRTKGQLIAEVLRNEGHAATIIAGEGKEGQVHLVSCMVRRCDAPHVRSKTDAVDPTAFVTGEEIRPLARGWFRA